MNPIFEYLDYRQYLRDFYNERKKENYFYSFRFMAQKLEIDHSLLVKIVAGKRHVSSAHVKHFCSLLGFTRPEEQYFTALVNFGKARNDGQSRIWLERMFSLQSHCSSKLERSQYEYFREWYYVAIRSLLDYCKFDGDYKKLGARLNPPISEAEARKAVELLIKLGLIEPGADGGYTVTERHVTTGEAWRSIAIRQFQEKAIKLSSESLRRDLPELRDISSVTMSIDEECFRDIKGILKECRTAIIKRVDQIQSEKKDRVYQLNLQFIPIAKPGEV